jgi:hypothetical protein
MVELGPAHIGTRLGFGNRDSCLLEHTLQRDHRRSAAMVDYRSGPIEYDRFDCETHVADPIFDENESG